MTSEREAVEFGGVKSYFFPSLLQYIINNEQRLLESSADSVNGFAAYFIGTNSDPPTDEEILTMLLAKENDADAIHTALDAMLVMGDRFKKAFEMHGGRLDKLNSSHDLWKLQQSAAQNDEDFEEVVSNHMMELSLESDANIDILRIINDIVFAASPLKKTAAIVKLTEIQLWFDALVLFKVLELDQKKPIFNRIKVSFLSALRTAHPQLAELIEFGPKADPDQELIRCLNQPIDVPSSEQIVAQIAERLRPLMALDDDAALENRAKLISQLFFIVTRVLVVDQRDIAKKIHSNIPEDMRKLMFSNLERVAFKSSIFLGHHMIQLFIEPKRSFDDWARFNLKENLESIWKKQVLARVLENYRFSISNNVFPFETPKLDPSSRGNNADLIVKVDNGLRFAIWIVKNYNIESTDSAVHELGSFSNNHKAVLLESFKKFVQGSDSRQHVTRIIEALQKSLAETVQSHSTKDYKSNDASNAPIQSKHEAEIPAQAVPPENTNFTYTKETMRTIYARSDPISIERVKNGIEETDSASLLNQTVPIGKGVQVAVVEAPLRAPEPSKPSVVEEIPASVPPAVIPQVVPQPVQLPKPTEPTKPIPIQPEVHDADPKTHDSFYSEDGWESNTQSDVSLNEAPAVQVFNPPQPVEERIQPQPVEESVKIQPVEEYAKPQPVENIIKPQSVTEVAQPPVAQEKVFNQTQSQPSENAASLGAGDSISAQSEVPAPKSKFGQSKGFEGGSFASYDANIAMGESNNRGSSFGSTGGGYGGGNSGFGGGGRGGYRGDSNGYRGRGDSNGYRGGGDRGASRGMRGGYNNSYNQDSRGRGGYQSRGGF